MSLRDVLDYWRQVRLEATDLPARCDSTPHPAELKSLSENPARA
jgi:hypothetical protein